MESTFTHPIERREAQIQSDLEAGVLHCLEGTLQRMQYPRKEFSVIAHGQVWHFTLAPDCQLWFDDRPAILRCFHPLDHVRIIFEDGNPTAIVKAMYAWEQNT